jgi:hypothetical protein
MQHEGAKRSKDQRQREIADLRVLNSFDFLIYPSRSHKA